MFEGTYRTAAYLEAPPPPRTCTYCGVERPAEKMASRVRCVACRNERDRERYAANVERMREKAREKSARRTDEQRAAHAEKMRALRADAGYRERERAKDRERYYRRKKRA